MDIDFRVLTRETVTSTDFLSNFLIQTADVTSPWSGLTAADQEYVRLLINVLGSPYSDEGLKVRPKWDDGTPAHTRRMFGYEHKFDLSDWRLPISFLRKTNWRGCLDEIFWIYQKASNKIADLHTHIWDSWDIGDGTIGKTYGYQIAQKVNYPGIGPMNQMEKVLHDLKVNPMDRGIITTMYNIHDIPEMGLRPCCYSMTYVVTRPDNSMEPSEWQLNAILNNRSQDIITANNWNVVQYSLLLMMVAHCSGMKPGYLMYISSDCHIYDRHVPIALDLIGRGLEERPEDSLARPGEERPVQVHINPDQRDFFKLTEEDITLTGYETPKHPYKVPVAV